jgi:hypothetical protein
MTINERKIVESLKFVIHNQMNKNKTLNEKIKPKDTGVMVNTMAQQVFNEIVELKNKTILENRDMLLVAYKEDRKKIKLLKEIYHLSFFKKKNEN